MAVEELSRIGAVAKPAVGPLTRSMLLDNEPAIRAKAAFALEAILRDDPDSPSSEAVASASLEAMKDRAPVVRTAACQLLRCLGRDRAADIPAARRALHDVDPAVRAAALVALVDVGERTAIPDAQLYPDIVEAMRTDDLHLRSQGIYVIDAMERKSPEIIRLLLRDSDARVRLVALEVMARFRPQPESLIPDVLAVVNDGDARVRVGAVHSLGLYSAPIAELDLSPLIALLQDPDRLVCTSAAVFLSRQGAAAEEARSALAKLRESQDDRVRAVAAEALRSIDEAIAELDRDVAERLAELRSSDHLAREEAANALGMLGPAARGAVPALREATHDPESAVRNATANALGKLRGSARPALADLDRLSSDDPSEDVRRAASAAGLLIRASGSGGVSREPR